MTLLTYIIPIIFALAVGFVWGFLSRGHAIDRLGAEIVQLKAAAKGVEIRTSARPQSPAQPSARLAGVRHPTMTPGHAATRTEPLPPRYSYTAEEN